MTVHTLDRVDDVHGYRVRLDEVETVLMEEDDVRAAAAAVVRTGSTPALAVYVVAGGRSVDHGRLRARLQARLRTRLPSEAVPEFLDVVRDLPTRPGGTVDRAGLPQPQHRISLGGAPYEPPRTASEVRMTAVWAQVLGVPLHAVSRDADFFRDLAGTRWLASTLVAALRRSGVDADVELADLYARPTVRMLAGRPSGEAVDTAHGTLTLLSRSV